MPADHGRAFRLMQLANSGTRTPTKVWHWRLRFGRECSGRLEETVTRQCGRLVASGLGLHGSHPGKVRDLIYFRLSVSGH
jgi:hypothetical protein